MSKHPPVKPGYVRVAYRCGCGFCDDILSAASEEALKELEIEHVAKHFEDYCEEEVAAGRMERVIRDGKPLYREVEAAAEPRSPAR